MTTSSGGAGKIIGGGRGMSIWTLTPAMAETGAKTASVKNNILKINFFIGVPPFFLQKSYLRKSLHCFSYLALEEVKL